MDTVVLQNALSWAQKYVISGRGVTMNILKVVVEPGKVLDNGTSITFNIWLVRHVFIKNKATTYISYKMYLYAIRYKNDSFLYSSRKQLLLSSCCC